MQMQTANNMADISKANSTPKAKNSLDGVRQKMASDEMKSYSSDESLKDPPLIVLGASSSCGARTAKQVQVMDRVDRVLSRLLSYLRRC